MSTPIWGPTPGQDDDRTAGGDPYAAPTPGAAGEATGERFGSGWTSGTGYPQAPAPSGYEARPSWEQGVPGPEGHGSGAHQPGAHQPGATAPVPSGSPYGPPPGGSAHPGAAPSAPYGTGPAGPVGPAASNPYGVPSTTPYGAPPSPQATPYGAAQPGAYGTAQPGAYGTPPVGAGYPPVPGHPGQPLQPGAPYGAPWTYQRPPRTEPLAVASLVTSLVGLGFPLTGPVGLGLGIAALRRIRRSGDQGRGMAVAGTVVGAVLTAFIVLMLVVVVALASTTDTSGPVSGGSTSTETEAPDEVYSDGTDTVLPPYELTIALTPGQCLADVPWEYDMSDAEVVDCATTHGAEVLGSIELSAPVSTDLTLADPAYDEAWAACDAQATAVLGAPVEETGYADLFYPHPDQWDAGGRSGYCVLVTNAWVTGSVVGGTMTVGAAVDI